MDMAVLAGSLSTAVFVTSSLPMLVKAVRTRDLDSYSRGQLVLANVGNVLNSVYAFSLPVGPIWFLHVFNLVCTLLMLKLARALRGPRGPRAQARPGPLNRVCWLDSAARFADPQDSAQGRRQRRARRGAHGQVSYPLRVLQSPRSPQEIQEPPPRMKNLITFLAGQRTCRQLSTTAKHAGTLPAPCSSVAMPVRASRDLCNRYTAELSST